MLKLMEKFVILVLDLGSKSVAIMIDNVMIVIFSVLIMRLTVALCERVITHVGVTGSVAIGIGVPDSVVIAAPVIGTDLDAVHIVVLIHMLWVVLPVVLVRVVVAHVVGQSRLNIVVRTVFLASEVALIVEVRLVVAQVPVALNEVRSGMVLLAVQHHHIVVDCLGVSIFVRSSLGAKVSGCVVRLLAALLRSLTRLRLFSLLFGFSVEESFLRSHGLVGLSLSLGRLGIVPRVEVVRSVSTTTWHMRIILISIMISCVSVSTEVTVAVGTRTRTIRTVWARRRAVGNTRATVDIGTRTVWVHWTESWGEVLAAHVAVVLLSSNIEVLILWLRLLALLCCVLRSWLSLYRLNNRELKAVNSVNILGVVGLHLENEVAILDVSLRRAERRRVGIKGSIIALVPAVSIEGIEVITPVEVEAVCVMVVNVSLNVIILDKPWHICGVESLAPGFESILL